MHRRIRTLAQVTQLYKFKIIHIEHQYAFLQEHMQMKGRTSMLQQRSVENVGAGKDRGKSSDREMKGRILFP